jgi:ketosteroid isomerase-like protein
MKDHPVAGLEQERCNALVAGDLKRVAGLLAPDLVYVHAPGIVHDRDALMHLLHTQVKFSAVERRGVKVHGDHAIAWTTGWMRIAGTRLPDGEPIAGASFVSQVWRRTGQAWQMVLFQSTRVDETHLGRPTGFG